MFELTLDGNAHSKLSEIYTKIIIVCLLFMGLKLDYMGIEYH